MGLSDAVKGWSTRNKLLAALGVFGLIGYCATSGDKQAPHPPVVSAPQAAPPSPASSPLASANTDAGVTPPASTAPPPAPPDPVTAFWSGLPALPERASDLEEEFWPVIDALAKDRIDERVSELESSKPATWKAEAPKLRAQLATERTAAAKLLKPKIYRAELGGDLVDLDRYNATKGQFSGDLPGVTEIDGTDWFLAFGKAPTVKRDVTQMPSKNALGMKTSLDSYDFSFTGGQPIHWTITIPKDEADRFAKDAKLKVEVAVSPVSGLVDPEHPKHPKFNAVGLGAKWASIQTESAGTALVVKLVGWRILAKDGRILASLQPAK